MEWTKAEGVSAHECLKNRAKGQNIIDKFLKATDGRYEATGATVFSEMVKFKLRHEAANTEHVLRVWFRNTPTGRDAYTFSMEHCNHFSRNESWGHDIKGTVDQCIKRMVAWEEPISKELEAYWSGYSRSMSMLKEAGFEHIDGSRFLAANVMVLEISVDGRIRIHNADCRDVEDIIAAIRPR